MIQITSAENAIVKHIKKLSGHTYREKVGETLLEGERLVCDSALYGAQLSAVLIREGYTGRLPKADRIYSLSQKLFDSLAETKSPQGILAVAKASYTSAKIREYSGLFVVCDQIQDPGNLGTIVRSAHAVDAKGVVFIKGCTDPFNPKAVRASMGSVFALPLIFSESLVIPEGYLAFCGVLASDSEDLYDICFPINSMLVLGNEANGVSDTIYKQCKHLRIPMPGGAESLNVSAAGAVVLYEYYRQVRYV